MGHGEGRTCMAFGIGFLVSNSWVEFMTLDKKEKV